jgi:hypothetical protein
MNLHYQLYLSMVNDTLLIAQTYTLNTTSLMTSTITNHLVKPILKLVIG